MMANGDTCAALPGVIRLVFERRPLDPACRAKTARRGPRSFPQTFGSLPPGRLTPTCLAAALRMESR